MGGVMKTRVFAVCAVVFLFCGVVHAGLDDGLVAHWSFDDCTAKDVSGNGHDGIKNGTICVDGLRSKALSFNGTSDFISSSSNNIPIANSARTISALVKPIVPTGGPIIGWGPVLTACNKACYLILNGTGFYLVGWCVENDLGGPANVLPNIWYYVTATYDGTIWRLYVNGGEVANKALSWDTIRTDIYIGSDDRGLSFFNGLIDDIRIYNRALSASEVQQLYQGQGTCSSEVVKFTAGTPAKAADVNANFDALNCQIQALKAIVCKNEPTASVCQ
jgi:hypothetical protein